jgi:hypothetical protein
MQEKKVLFTDVFFPLVIMLVKYVLNDGISQAFTPFRFVDVIVHVSEGEVKSPYFLQVW